MCLASGKGGGHKGAMRWHSLSHLSLACCHLRHRCRQVLSWPSRCRSIMNAFARHRGDPGHRGYGERCTGTPQLSGPAQVEQPAQVQVYSATIHALRSEVSEYPWYNGPIERRIVAPEGESKTPEDHGITECEAHRPCGSVCASICCAGVAGHAGPRLGNSSGSVALDSGQ